MPKAIEADKELAKSLFIQGLPISTIARQIGVNINTVGTWTKRGQWTQLRGRTIEALDRPLIGATLAEHSARMRETLAKGLTETASTLDTIKQKRNLPTVLARAEAMQKLTASAGKVFGWDAESTPAIVNMNLMKNDPDLK